MVGSNLNSFRPKMSDVSSAPLKVDTFGLSGLQMKHLSKFDFVLTIISLEENGTSYWIRGRWCDHTQFFPEFVIFRLHWKGKSLGYAFSNWRTGQFFVWGLNSLEAKGRTSGIPERWWSYTQKIFSESSWYFDNWQFKSLDCTVRSWNTR